MEYIATYFFTTLDVRGTQRETLHGVDLADVWDLFWIRHPDAVLHSVDDPQLDPPYEDEEPWDI